MEVDQSSHSVVLSTTSETHFFSWMPCSKAPWMWERERAVLAHEMLPRVTAENAILQLHEYEAFADCMPTPYSQAQQVYLWRRMPKIKMAFQERSRTPQILQNSSKLVIFKCFIWNTNWQVLGINISNYSILNFMSNLILRWNNLKRETEGASAKSIPSEMGTLLMQWGGCVQRQPH